MSHIVAVLDWINTHGDLIGVILAILAGALHVFAATRNLREGLLSLMLQTEKAAAKGELGNITGPQMMDLVVRTAMERVVPKLPASVRPFVTENTVRRLAGWVYEGARTWLTTGSLLPKPELVPAALPEVKLDTPVDPAAAATIAAAAETLKVPADSPLAAKDAVDTTQG